MAYMNEKDFKKHISSKKFNNIYVIFGDEKYLVKFYAKDLAEKVAGKEPSEFAYHEYSDEASLQDIADAVGTVPFMAEYNCVVVKDYDVNKLSKDEYDSLIQILKSVPLSTVVIFSYVTDPLKKVKEDKETDEKKGRDKFKLLCSAVDKMGMGAVAEINMRTAISLEQQLSKWAAKMGKKLSLPLASKIIYFCSTDLNTLKLELEKVCAYAGDNEEITLEMIEATVTKKLEAKVYDLVENVISKRTEKAYQELQQLFAMREEPRNIVMVLGYAYVDLYRSRVAKETDTQIKDVATYFEYKNRDWVLRKYQQKYSNISMNVLRESLGAIIELAEKFNSVTVNGEAMVTKLIADLLLIAVKEQNYA